MTPLEWLATISLLLAWFGVAVLAGAILWVSFHRLMERIEDGRRDRRVDAFLFANWPETRLRVSSRPDLYDCSKDGL